MQDVQKAFARTVAIDADKEELHRDEDALGPVRMRIRHACVDIIGCLCRTQTYMRMSYSTGKLSPLSLPLFRPNLPSCSDLRKSSLPRSKSWVDSRPHDWQPGRMGSDLGNQSSLTFLDYMFGIFIKFTTMG